VWSGPGMHTILGASGNCAQGESTTVLRRLTRGNELCGANNICNLLKTAVQSGLGDLILTSSPASFTFPPPRRPRPSKPPATPAPTPSRSHSPSRTRPAHPNPNGCRTSQDWRQRLPRPVPGIRIPLRPHPSTPSPPRPSHHQKTPVRNEYTVDAAIRPKTARFDDQTALPTHHVSNRGDVVVVEQQSVTTGAEPPSSVVNGHVNVPMWLLAGLACGVGHVCFFFCLDIRLHDHAPFWCAVYRLGTGLDGGQRGSCNEPPLSGLRTESGQCDIVP